MSKQSTTTRYVAEMKKLLKYEKDYMEILDKIISSDDFQNDLCEMFACIDLSKDLIGLKYEGANFINTPAERLVAYHMYKYLHDNGRFDSAECYPSPVCSDIAIELDDVILNVEVKTLGAKQNKTDLRFLQFETNQITFDNKEILSSGNFTGYEVKANMDPYYAGKPIVTYVIEIVYDYDPKSTDSSFKLYKGVLQNGIRTINLFCIPNGKLSTLFDRDIVLGFKDYKYYAKEAKADDYFKPKKIENVKKYKTLKDVNGHKHEFQKFVRRKFQLDDGWIDIGGDMLGFIDTNRKGDELHEKDGYVWIVVAKGSGSKKYLQLEPVKGGSTGRINYLLLEDRYDGDLNPWKGVIHYSI